MSQLSHLFSDPVAVYAARGAIALLFAMAAVSKARNFSIFRATLLDYELVPKPMLGVVATMVLGLEIAIAVLVWLPSFAPIAMLAAATLLLTYASAIGINLLRGRRDIDCGCTGPAVRQSLSAWLILRNLGLASVAVIGINLPAARALQLVDIIVAVVVVMVSSIIYAAANQLMANSPRLDALDGLMETN